MMMVIIIMGHMGMVWGGWGRRGRGRGKGKNTEW
jgi:hypothetical protein